MLFIFLNIRLNNAPTSRFITILENQNTLGQYLEPEATDGGLGVRNAIVRVESISLRRLLQEARYFSAPSRYHRGAYLVLSCRHRPRQNHQRCYHTHLVRLDGPGTGGVVVDNVV